MRTLASVAIAREENETNTRGSCKSQQEFVASGDENYANFGTVS